MQRQDAQFRSIGMAHRTSLAAGNAGGDHDIAEKRGRASGRKGQDVGGCILAPEPAIEGTHLGVGRKRDRNFAAKAGRHDRGHPSGEALIPDRTAATVRDRHKEAATVGIHRTIRTP